VFSVRKQLPLPAGKTGAKRMPRPSVEWSDDDAKAFVAAVKAAGVPVDAALNVYAAESGLDPQASSGIAWGLAQFVGKTLKGLGWQRSAAEFGGLSVAEQAPWITKLLKAQVAMLGRVPSSALDLYVLNFWPAAARAGYDVILVRDSRVAKERAAYEANKASIANAKATSHAATCRPRLTVSFTYQRLGESRRRSGGSQHDHSTSLGPSSGADAGHAVQ
jgi:hypothetical protein